ncbi:MAG: hypothetical protein ACQEP1_03275, partial [Nanobdellota archaeon]
MTNCVCYFTRTRVIFKVETNNGNKIIKNTDIHELVKNSGLIETKTVEYNKKNTFIPQPSKHDDYDEYFMTLVIGEKKQSIHQLHCKKESDGWKAYKVHFRPDDDKEEELSELEKKGKEVFEEVKVDPEEIGPKERAKVSGKVKNPDENHVVFLLHKGGDEPISYGEKPLH